MNEGIASVSPDQAHLPRVVHVPLLPRESQPVPSIQVGAARRIRPFLAATVAFLGGFVALAVVTIAVGALLVEVLLHGFVQRADNDAVHWLAAHRTPTWTEVSWVGSHVAGALTVVVVAALTGGVLLLRRNVPLALFLLTAVTVEATTYLVTVQFIDRQRPEVHRLEALGQGASFPSGHTAAAVALYGGLAMIAVALGARISVRWLAIVVAVLATLVVGISRMYRGMHHPLDVVLGAAVGVGCLAVGTFVAWVFVRSHASARTAHEVRGS